MPVNPSGEMGLFIGAMTAGTVCGLMPIAAGCRKRRLGVAIAGFLPCLLFGYVGGFILALPGAFIISMVINCLPKAGLKIATAESMGYTINPYAGGRRSAFDHNMENAFAGTSADPTMAERPVPAWD